MWQLVVLTLVCGYCLFVVVLVAGLLIAFKFEFWFGSWLMFVLSTSLVWLGIWCCSVALLLGGGFGTCTLLRSLVFVFGVLYCDYYLLSGYV